MSHPFLVPNGCALKAHNNLHNEGRGRELGEIGNLHYTEPNQDDIFLTRRLKEAGRIMCIELLDHLITGERSYISLKETGFL
jgi:hypothetical protein